MRDQNRHTESLIRLIREQPSPPLAGAEIGVWKGATTAALLRAFPDLVLLAVDPWDLGVRNRYYKRKMLLRKAEFERATAFASARLQVFYGFSVAAASAVADGSLCFAFIDGDHLYAAVKADLAAWWPKIRSGCVLCGHDYDGPYDRRGEFQVKPAVDSWAAEAGLQIRTLPGCVWWVRKP